MKKRTLFLVLVLGFPILLGASGFSSKCEKFKNWPGGYCIHTPNAQPSGDIVYHLHGRGNNEFTWADDWYYTAQIRREWEKTGLNQPIVISVSFGPTWLLAEKNSSPQSGLFEVFVNKVIPQIESQIGSFKRRIVFGESMGGFNSIQLALKTNLFNKAAILCSPMMEVSLFAPQEEIHDHVKKSSAWHYYKDFDPEAVFRHVDILVKVAKAFYPTEENWKTGDPLQLARDRKAQSAPQFYTAVGFHDPYAAYEGNEKFAEILKANGIEVEWRPQWGGHCAIDIPSLARFLVE